MTLYDTLLAPQTADEPGCTAANAARISRGEGGWDATTCNMRAWLEKTITADVREIETYFRVRKRTGQHLTTIPHHCFNY